MSPPSIAAHNSRSAVGAFVRERNKVKGREKIRERMSDARHRSGCTVTGQNALPFSVSAAGQLQRQRQLPDHGVVTLTLGTSAVGAPPYSSPRPSFDSAATAPSSAPCAGTH